MPPHSVAYKWRCVGASNRTARDLRPLISAFGDPERALSCTENASVPCFAASCEHSSKECESQRNNGLEGFRRTAQRPCVPSRSASSKANGRRVSRLPASLGEVSAPTHNASSRSAGCTSVPCCVERIRRRAVALSSPPVHA
eukprot:3325733-Prymnesium_polylepis.2